jgi:hypothetical protein
MDPKMNFTQINEPIIEPTLDEQSIAVHALLDAELQMVGGGDNVVCW